MPLRLIAWLFAFCALALPPAVAPAAAMEMGAHAAMSDCPHHHPLPPPAPCPEKGTAKHAAGCCCPLMAHAVALLPKVQANADMGAFDSPVPSVARLLTGLSPHEDPPPPRA